MDELSFMMRVKLIQKYDERICDFFNLIDDYVEKKHKGILVGIKEINYGGIQYVWSVTRGCRGCYDTTYTTQFDSFNTILQFIQDRRGGNKK